MNNNELIAKIAQENDLDKKQVEVVLKSLATIIKHEVTTKGEFTLLDIGKFKVKPPALERRNPSAFETFALNLYKEIKR